MRAVIYKRVSSDTSGRARSPEEQEADGRRDCDRAGWEVTHVLTDNDRGASRYSKGERPAFEDLKKLASSRAVDVIVVWEASRLQRDLAVYVELRDLCRDHGILWSYNGRLYDLDDADDAFTTGMDALLSEREVAYTSKRVRRALAANAAAGLPHGRPLLGYQRVYDKRTGQLVGQVADITWAPLVRETFQRVAAGHSLRQVATWLNDAGHPLPTSGEPWTGPRVSGQIRGRVGYLGHREHAGRIIVRDAWPALVDEITFNRVQSMLADPARRRAPTGAEGALLVGLLRCGQCGGRVDLTSVGRAGKQRRVYRCQRLHLGRSAEVLDRIFTKLLVERLSRPDALAAFTYQPDDLPVLRAEMDDVQRQLSEVEQAIMDRSMPAVMAARVATDLERQVADLQGKIDAAGEGVSPVLLSVVGGDVERKWAALTTSGRRTVAGLVLCDLRLLPVGKGVRRPGVSFRWVGSEETHDL